MKLINPSYTILEQAPGIEGIYKQIELAGRTCYKSEDKITEDSAKDFVDRMIKSNHTAMLEHGTVYLYIKHNEKDGVDMGDPYNISLDLVLSPYCKRHSNFDTHESYYTTNLRWLVEKYPEDWQKILETYACEPTEFHPKRHTVKMTTSIHVYKDLTRHRKMSFAIESTRYCNYTNGKFGGEVTFIDPVWRKSNKGAYEQFISALHYASTYYKFLIQAGWQAQQAAEVLPQCTKADVVMTGFEDDWDHVFDLRALGTTGKPHPEVERIITPIMNEFYEKHYTDRRGIESAGAKNSRK